MTEQSTKLHSITSRCQNENHLKLSDCWGGEGGGNPTRLSAICDSAFAG